VGHLFLPNGSSFLSAKMFDPESRMEPGVQRDGAYFLDRDPAYFSIVLNYLRSGVLLGARMRGEGGNFTRTYLLTYLLLGV